MGKTEKELNINDLRMRLATYDYPNQTEEQTSDLIKEAFDLISELTSRGV